MKITKITIVKRKNTTDLVTLHTDLPTPYVYLAGQEHCLISFATTVDTAEEYVKKHFPEVKDVEVFSEN